MSKNRTLITAAAMLLACVTFSHGQDTGKVQFRLRLKEGQSFRSEMVARQAITQNILGNEQKMDQTMGMTYRYDVESVAPDGTATIKVSYEAVKMAMDAPTGKIDYDSKNPAAEIPAAARGVAAMVGQSFTMEMNSQGQVTKVEGLGALMDRIISEIDLPDDATKSMINDMLEKQFGDEAMVGNMQAMMAHYPEEPVGVGDTWTKKANVTAGFPMQLENTYTLKSRAGGMATLDVQTKIRSDPDAEPVTMGPMKITYNISGQQSGEMVLHETAGWTMSSQMTMEFKGDVKVSGMPGMAEGATWPISCTGETTVKTTK
jgi:uncharacterized protein DUF6263